MGTPGLGRSDFLEPLSVSVGETSTLLCEKNTNRTYLAISNGHATTGMRLGVGYPAVSGKGILIPAQQTYEFLHEINLSIEAVYGIIDEGCLSESVSASDSGETICIGVQEAN